MRQKALEKAEMMENTVEARIVSDPKIMMGKPCIRGTRIIVEHLLRMMAAGLSVSDIIEEHSHLTKDDIHAACLFAAESLRGTWLKSQNDQTRTWMEDAVTTTEH